MKKNFRIDDLKDDAAKENFQKVEGEFNSNYFLKGKWQLVEITVTGAVTDQLFPHQLGFQPTDIIQTQIKGAGLLTWNFDSFTRSNINFTTTGACTVRALIGRL